jgi:hypothetical protein
MPKVRVQFTFEPTFMEWDPDSHEGLTAEARERVVDWIEQSAWNASSVEMTREDDAAPRS